MSRDLTRVGAFVFRFEFGIDELAARLHGRTSDAARGFMTPRAQAAWYAEFPIVGFVSRDDRYSAFVIVQLGFRRG